MAVVMMGHVGYSRSEKDERNRMRLGAKLTLWLLIPLLLVLSVFAGVTLQRERLVHYREVSEEAERVANTLAVSVTDALRRQKPEDIRRIAEASGLDPARFGLVVYDPQGRPFFTSGLGAKAGAVGRRNLSRYPLSPGDLARRSNRAGCRCKATSSP